MPAVTTYAKTSNAYIDGVLGDLKWAVGALTFSFPASGSYYGASYGWGETSNNFGALYSTQIATSRTVFSSISAVTNLTFTEITETSVQHADLRLARSDAPSTAWAYFPSTAAEGGDSWFNNSSGYYSNPVKGNYAYATFFHEVGHALGLQHTHEAYVMPTDRDSMEYSLMTYRSYVGASVGGGYINEAWGYAQSMMMYDIAGLQHMYGANYATNSGNTTYTWSPATGEMFINGIGQGAPGGNRIFLTIWDGGGVDTYNFSNHATDLTVNLNPGGWSTTSATQLAKLHYLGSEIATGNIANALLYNGDARSLIERVIGGSGHDSITGNDANNELFGGSGNDMLFGGAGADRLYGGPGGDRLDGGDRFDYAIYDEASYGGFTASLYYAGWNTGVAAGDSYFSIEGLILGVNSDTGYGNDAVNYIYGRTGNDTIFGMGNQDFIFGEDGNDNLIGGDGHDHLFGGIGADLLQGGSGFDYVRYDEANYSDFTVSLSTPSSNSGVAAGDVITGVEGLILSSGNDTAYGDGQANYIYGRAGNDTLYGLAGNDHLFGEAGADRFIFNTAPSDRNTDVIGDFVSGLDSIGLARLYFGAADTGGGVARLTQGANAATAQATLLFDSTTKLLTFDSDGTGPDAAQPFALLADLNFLAESDLFFV
ncbi:serralysin [Hoeflea halophila]|uniref:Serralysin n=1 Tax=Hoeflea halophila TaxID=714899 RepID=A0A286IAV1_9HYPH|nr:M10 family metallopeptidase C-terminal domain-containing protein [Hoeflea halophila]SOE17220.1 serralysin [Hoeflea halophila]